MGCYDSVDDDFSIALKLVDVVMIEVYELLKGKRRNNGVLAQEDDVNAIEWRQIVDLVQINMRTML